MVNAQEALAPDADPNTYLGLPIGHVQPSNGLTPNVVVNEINIQGVNQLH